MIEEILNQAKKAGACKRTDGITTWPELTALYFSPQGREFCKLHNFPDIDTWRKVESSDGDKLQRRDIYVDMGTTFHTMRGGCIALIGDTHGKIICNGNADICHIILQHGATATITATNYAVVEILKFSPDTHAEVQTDKTTILL